MQGETTPHPWIRRLTGWRPEGMGPRHALKILFAVTFTGLFPAIVIVVVQDPVAILSVSGIVATIHTPFIVFTMLALNRRIPEPARPSLPEATLLGSTGLLYTVLAILYFADLAGLIGG